MNPIDPRRQFDWKFPATLNNVEQVCSGALKVLEKYSLHKKDQFAVELLLREAINNAFMHGCHRDPLLFFSCSLVISEKEVIIAVSDEGTGFDWRRKPESLPKSSCESGRGLCIYSIYANSIIYNDRGNCVTLTRIFNQGDKGE